MEDEKARWYGRGGRGDEVAAGSVAEDAVVPEELVLAPGLGRRMRRARASGGESGGGWMRTAEKPGREATTAL